MCQKCFFNGRKAKNHKLTHPMQEYCTAVSDDLVLSGYVTLISYYETSSRLVTDIKSINIWWP